MDMTKLNSFQKICVSLIALPTIYLLVFAAIYFPKHPLSESPPNWGDAISFISVVGAYVGIYFLYTQIKEQKKVNLEQRVINKDQKIKDLVSVFQARISKLPQILESIRYTGKNTVIDENQKKHIVFTEYSGSEAIVKYGEDYESVKENHPRLVIDKVAFITLSISNLLIDIGNEKEKLDKNQFQELITEVLLFYYTSLYFPLTFERTIDKKKGIVLQFNKEYGILKNRINDLKIISYLILRKYKAIDEHDESEEFKDEQILDNNLKALYSKI